MEGLLLRLSTLDADAESAVRVIAYFDSLVRNHASVSVLLQATARLTQCPVGLVDSVTGRRMRVSSPGGAVERSDAPTGPPAGRPLGSSLGSVWIEREGPAHGLDEIVLERFAGAAEVTLERAAALAQAGNDPALVELVLSADAGEAERARALRLLGFGPAARVQVLAGPAGDGAALAAHLRAAGITPGPPGWATPRRCWSAPWWTGCPGRGASASGLRWTERTSPAPGRVPGPPCASPARTPRTGW
ncbi:hypothetical protein [Streptosporangium minutum]|uniref:hypothetical protein n=1 Tax=Streptosporangium minutum TaxID=569862 RepID=UPI001A99AAA7|nr:hypothetical protein [Streptosporangium minutum]